VELFVKTTAGARIAFDLPVRLSGGVRIGVAAVDAAVPAGEPEGGNLALAGVSPIIEFDVDALYPLIGPLSAGVRLGYSILFASATVGVPALGLVFGLGL